MTRQNFSAVLWFCASFFISACTAPTLAEFEVQRPARISIPREVQKVFIRADLVVDSNDKLGLKTQLLEQLAAELNRLGRFKVSVQNTFDEIQFDAEKETVAIIQGEVISGGEVDKGQFTDLATCTGGIGGRISSVGAAAITEQAITVDSWRAYVCRPGAFAADVTEVALSSALALAGLNEVIPPKNQVVRIYNYKNLSLFAQANFSFTMIGKRRETLAIRADSASFGRSIKEKDSYHNIKESHLIAVSLGSLISISRIPIFPIPVRQLALAGRSNPKQLYYGPNRLPVPGIYDLPPGEKKEVIQLLVRKTLQSFIRTISPYKIMVGAEIASGGKAAAGNMLEEGNAKKARQIIEAIPEIKRSGDDWYNLGLAYEASAVSQEDYEDARRFYINALEKSPEKRLYAQGVGRTRRYLAETKTLAKQLRK
ncbi:MAG: hypothetical protein H8E38_01985 [SAR324 cluster bacterium]|nr:hypothetical protein [SAR324 cluster bacterium]MBL7034937.1 hypothetical protein [SAR324 cluster bacterium]